MTNTYDAKTTPWEIRETEYPAGTDAEEHIRFLLRYAILAPSTHNSQPWKFSIDDNKITVHADMTRWLKVSDADKRELYLSIGCAIENLLVAADHFGCGHAVAYHPEREDGAVATITVYPGSTTHSPADNSLFDMIPVRCTNHTRYDDRRVPSAAMLRIRDCCREEDFRLYSTNDAENETEYRVRIEELTARADAMQFADRAYKEELAWWVGEGALGAAWLTAKISKLAITHLDISKGQSKKDSNLILSAPSLVVLCSETDDRRSQVIAGQIYERIALTAAAMGMALHPMSQILEVPTIKKELCSLIPEKAAVPQQTFRLGYAEPEKQHTPRRPLEEMLIWNHC